MTSAGSHCFYLSPERKKKTLQIEHQKVIAALNLSSIPHLLDPSTTCIATVLLPGSHSGEDVRRSLALVTRMAWAL